MRPPIASPGFSVRAGEAEILGVFTKSRKQDDETMRRPVQSGKDVRSALADWSDGRSLEKSGSRFWMQKVHRRWFAASQRLLMLVMPIDFRRRFEIEYSLLGDQMFAALRSIRLLISRPVALCFAVILIADARCVFAQQRRAPVVANSLAELNEKAIPGIEIPASLDARAAHRATAGGLPVESRGNFGMSPHATAEQSQRAVAAAKTHAIDGPVKETWQSIDEHYQLPKWMQDGKLGIFIHFGLYSIPAHGSEWYEKHMYSDAGTRRWHAENYGPLDEFGYKDFIPKFTLAGFDPNQWAEVFQASGATWVMPTAEHHDGFSLWNSKVNPFNSVKLGPKRDFIGELAAAVRRRA